MKPVTKKLVAVAVILTVLQVIALAIVDLSIKSITLTLNAYMTQFTSSCLLNIVLLFVINSILGNIKSLRKFELR